MKLPENFKQKLVECVDPSQSIDYQVMGGRTFPIQVLCLGLEKKFNRLAKKIETEYEETISITVAEIVHLYNPDLDLDWVGNHVRSEQIEQFYLAHQKKLLYSDDVERVVAEVESLIEWKPYGDSDTEEARRYLVSHIFLPVFIYQNMIEGVTTEYLFKHYTRGHLDLIRLNNRLSADRMRIVDKEEIKKRKLNDKMNNATSSDEFMAGLAEQGLNLGSIF